MAREQSPWPCEQSPWPCERSPWPCERSLQLPGLCRRVVSCRRCSRAAKGGRIELGEAEQGLVGGPDVRRGQAGGIQLAHLLGDGYRDLDVLPARGSVEVLSIGAELR